MDDYYDTKKSTPDRDELSIRKTKSSRSTKTEVYDADDTIRSIRSYHRARRQAQVHKTPSGEDTRASNRNRTIQVTTAPSASELFDSDVMSLKSNRTRTGDMLEHRERSKPKVRGLSGILGEYHPKPISPKSQRSSSSWRSDRSIRKYSDVERTKSNEQLDFDVDRVVVVPDGILKNSTTREGPNKQGGGSSRIAFAPDAQTMGLQRQHSEQEEM